MTDDWTDKLESAAAAKGWTSREGLIFDETTGEVSDASQWELDQEEGATTEPADVRYIKLGPGGAWFDRCRSEGLIEIGHAAVPHALAAAGDWSAVHAAFAAANPTKASDFTRELRDFYTLPSSTIWITMADSRLWWAKAEPEVHAVEGEGAGIRARRVIGSWSDKDERGDTLWLDGLSTRLTKVGAYRQTICRVGHADYLLRRLRGEPEPAVATALAAQKQLATAVRTLIEGLDWRDFELMTDLIFAQSGWRRVSAVGGSAQADSDLILEQIATGERATVQVKSSMDQSTLDDYVARFARSQRTRGFLVCHSPTSKLVIPESAGFHIWLGDTLAEKVIVAGLTSWLIEKSR